MAVRYDAEPLIFAPDTAAAFTDEAEASAARQPPAIRPRNISLIAFSAAASHFRCLFLLYISLIFIDMHDERCHIAFRRFASFRRFSCHDISPRRRHAAFTAVLAGQLIAYDIAASRFC